MKTEYLAPYLPYNLKVLLVNHKSLEGKEYVYELDGKNFATVDGIIRKPILRPLSDLLNDDFKMAKFRKEAILYLDETANLPYNNRFEHMGGIMYSDILKLFRCHFDVFGLIKKGLAIDKNTL